MPDLDERFRSLSRISAPDLWSEIDEREPREVPARGAGRRSAVAAVALVVAIAGVGLAAWAFRADEREAGTTAVVANGRIAFVAFDGSTWQIYSAESDGTGVMQLTQLEDPLMASEPAWSPDGSRLTYVVRESASVRSDIWVMHADGSDAHPITDGSGSNWSPAWSPDGSRIAFTHGNDIFVMAADGTNVTNLTSDPEHPTGAFDPAWSPDGEFIAFIGRETDDDLHVMRSDGSDVRTLFSAPGAQREVAWSPDGSTIAFVDHTKATESEVGEITLIDPTGTVVARLSDLPPVAQAPEWSPDGRQIAFMAYVTEGEREALYVMNADGTDVHEIPGLPANAAWPAWQSVPAEETTPSPSPTTPPADGSISAVEGLLPEGRLLVQVDDQVELLEQGAERSKLLGQDLLALDLSPDGSRALVATPLDSAGQERALVSLDLTSGERTRIADLDSWAYPAHWSPDGSSVAVRMGERNLLCLRDLAIDELRCLPELGRVFAFDWSPDGTRIVFEQGAPGALTILDVGTEETSILARWDDPAVLAAVAAAGVAEPVAIQFQGPQWSPSGRYIAVLGMVGTDDGHSNLVLVFDLDGNVVARGVPFGEFTSARGWSPVTDEFANAAGEPPYQTEEVRSLDVSTGEDRLLASIAGAGLQTIRSMAWSPSGRWVAIVALTAPGAEIHVLDTTGIEPPRIIEVSVYPELVDWGP